MSTQRNEYLKEMTTQRNELSHELSHLFSSPRNTFTEWVEQLEEKEDVDTHCLF